MASMGVNVSFFHGMCKSTPCQVETAHLRFAVSVAMVMAEAITTVLHINGYIIVKHLLTKLLPPFRLCFM